MTDENTDDLTEDQDAVSALDMSDEDVLKMAMPDETPAEPADDDEDTGTDNDAVDDVDADATDDTDDTDADAEQETEEELAAAKAKEEEDAEAQAKATPEDKLRDAFAEGSKVAAGDEDADKDPGSKKAAKEDKVDKADDKKAVAINYEEEYKKLIAPFRANGKDINVANVEDAITLMKMGANYNKKMAGLKPNLKLMKMLANNELLDEEKLTYLIDLQKKDPAAVAKFIKDSGIDPLDIDVEKDAEYKPGTYTVNDKEVELDLILEGIQDTKSFDETIDIISNKWDDSSRKVLLAEPNIIGMINDHVGSGIYGQINTIVESERMLGRLTELSDLDAYKHVGQILQDNGAFDQEADKAPVNEDKVAPVIKPTKAVKKVDPKLNNRRRAASSPRGVPKKQAPDFNPLAMSDEEFEKVAGNIGI